MNELPEVKNLTVIEREDMHRQILEYTFETIIIHANHKVLYINESGAKFLRGNKEDIIGAGVLDVFHEGCKPLINERIENAMMENKVGELIEREIIRLDGTTVEVEFYCHPIIFGDRRAIQSTFRDITDRKEVERKLKKMINEISTPIVPVSEGIAVIPLVGSIDNEKAAQLLNTLPPKLKMHNLNYLIIDFSGIYNLDEVVVEFLFNIHSIMKLLGICPVVTGIRPELAQKAVEIGKTLGAIKAMSNVKQALQVLEAR